MKCAIFCKIIDNFGDIGVCWRLARQLSNQYAVQVDLFVDDLNSFAQLAATLQTDLAVQQLDQIRVFHWHASLLFEQPYHLVIEGFACRLSDSLIVQMAQQLCVPSQPKSSAKFCPPLWINLEYLSAEQWALDCHAMQSIHPATGLKQTFWFPSVTEQSGGLIREQCLLAEREQFQSNLELQNSFWITLGISNSNRFNRKISLFSYQNFAISQLLDSLANDQQSSLLLVPYSKSIADIQQWLGHSVSIGDQIQRQNLSICILPFLNHQQYDHLLWACDLNFVRGEDSLVRAHWAAKPFLWHIYPQDDDAHWVKLEAWLEAVRLHVSSTAIKSDTMDFMAMQSWYLAMYSWNAATQKHGVINLNWQHCLQDLTQWQLVLKPWFEYLNNQHDLSRRLMDWVVAKSQWETCI